MSKDEKALEDQEWIEFDEDEEKEEKAEESAPKGTVYSREGNGPLYIVEE